MRVLFSPEARDEFTEAERYYEEQLPGLGARFRGEVRVALRRARMWPLRVETVCKRGDGMSSESQSAAEQVGLMRASKRVRATPHRFDQRTGSEDLDRPLQVVGQHMQAHLGSHVRQRSDQEVGRAHPGLERSEHVLDGLPPFTSGLKPLVEPILHSFEHVLVLPASDPAVLAGRALWLERALRAGRGPVLV